MISISSFQRVRRAFATTLAGLALCIVAEPSVSADTSRIRFHVLTVVESSHAREVLSEATIDGPGGTDFEVELRGGRFRMTARFLTGAVKDGALNVKATLETRRLHGRSERDLPLYEEDVQKHDLSLDLQEQIILLPFGSPTDDEQLRVEITPTLLPEAARDPEQPDLAIDILKRSEDGSVSIRAFRLPHRFSIVAALFRNGREAARGRGAVILEEPGSVRLGPTSGSSLAPMELSIHVSRVLRECPTDLFAYEYRIGGVSGSGIAPLGAPLELAVSDPMPPGGGRDVLRFTVQATDLD